MGVKLALQRLLDGFERGPMQRQAARDLAQEADEPEPPVVVRMVVELRSDGRRTVVRGAIEDLIRNEAVALSSAARNPLELIGSLMRSLTESPTLASRQTAATELAERSEDADATQD